MRGLEPQARGPACRGRPIEQPGCAARAEPTEWRHGPRGRTWWPFALAGAESAGILPRDPPGFAQLGSSAVKRRIALLPAAVPLILFATQSSAQPAAQPAADTTDTSLDEVVVVANRAPVPLSKVGSSVTVLDEQDIKESQATITSDLLAQTPGISVARTGGVGQPTSVFIRGAESDQTVVVIDGVVMNDPSQVGGGYDFQNLLIGDIS